LLLLSAVARLVHVSLQNWNLKFLPQIRTSTQLSYVRGLNIFPSRGYIGGIFFSPSIIHFSVIVALLTNRKEYCNDSSLSKISRLFGPRKDSQPFSIVNTKMARICLCRVFNQKATKKKKHKKNTNRLELFVKGLFWVSIENLLSF